MIKVVKRKTKKTPSGKRTHELESRLGTMRHKSEEERTAMLARATGLPYLDLNIVPIDAETAKQISENDSRKVGIGVVQKIGRNVMLVVTDPGSAATQEYVAKLKEKEGWTPKLIVVSPSSMKKIWNSYKSVSLLEIVDEYKVSLTREDLERFEREVGDLVNLKKRIAELPTTEVVNMVMAGAVKLGASDIHLEPQKSQFRMRYRIDGVLQDVTYLPLSIYRYIVSRIKVMAHMKLNITDAAQDGHFVVTLDKEEIDVRVSILPGDFGETVVMRLLLQSSIQVDLEESGLRGRAYEIVQNQIRQTTGMIITSGPTGSGKTTTLYSIIRKVNKSSVKIITIEDPVEYRLKGISQTQVNKARGYTFANGLRSIVRQDPDMVLVGEIRDEETASIAVQAALTGHLVFSTIHANHAAGIIPRLIEMGIKPNLIAPAMNALVAQRLVRRLCPHCKEVYSPAQETVNQVKKIIAIISPKAKIDIPKKIDKLYRPKGCSQCNFIGYKGRIGIFEVMIINSEIEKLVLNMAGESELLAAALESGMITLLQDGMIKALEGITSLEEVERVTGGGTFLEDVYDKLMVQTLSRGLTVTEDDFVKAEEGVADIKKAEILLEKTETSRLVELMMAVALFLEAGDIHIEPKGDRVLVRFRIDGILQDVFSLPLEEYPALLGQIKELSGFKAEVREGVKDGRFSINLEKPYKHVTDTQVDIRISIILGGYGETAVMRLLNQSASSMELEALGFRRENLDKLVAAIQKPYGIVFNTGPTGSGKTTTLYSLLDVLNKSEVKIITVEDPIEYRMEGILQTQVNEREGYTFSSALRSLLRQNPDVMMIGEIRDSETAEIALQAALTGHLVLSTLHTNDAAGSVQRLASMGASLSNIASATNVFAAQRLVRKLCECKKKVKPTAEQKKKIEGTLSLVSKKSEVQIPSVQYIYAPAGCPQCRGIGYRGRSVIAEVLAVEKEIEELIVRGAVTSEIVAKGIEKGMLTMAQDGMLKVIEGITTLEEVQRVTEE